MSATLAGKPVHAARIPAASKLVPIALDWPIGVATSSELTALHLTSQLHDHQTSRVVPFMSPTMALDALQPAMRPAIARVFDESQAECLRLIRESDSVTLPMIALQLLGRGLEGLPTVLPLPARRNIGIIQTCDTAFGTDARARGSRFDAVLAGSMWMRDVLIASGIANVGVYPTGIDTSLFMPGQKSGRMSQRFVIFSGGGLQYHKGQDLVLAAVKQFQQRHPETLLLTVWQTPFPESSGDMTLAGHLSTAPAYYGGQLDIAGWATENGLSAGSVVDLGRLSPAALAVAMREADVALFPNRAETDANPMVLECMASGVPVIVSQNTGHLDLAQPALCYPLTQQRPVRATSTHDGTDGWGESSVDEMVAHLETVYAQSSAATLRAHSALEFAKGFGWDVHAPRLVELLAPLISELARR